MCMKGYIDQHKRFKLRWKFGNHYIGYIRDWGRSVLIALTIGITPII